MKLHAKLLRVCGICAAWIMSGCMTVHSISANQVPVKSERTNKISVSTSSLIVLGIPFDDTFVEDARDQFTSKCQGGNIDGVLTKFQTTYYGFVAVPEVTMEGYCVKRSIKERA